MSYDNPIVINRYILGGVGEPRFSASLPGPTAFLALKVESSYIVMYLMHKKKSFNKTHHFEVFSEGQEIPFTPIDALINGESFKFYGIIEGPHPRFLFERLYPE